jgi:hypothetical protein
LKRQTGKRRRKKKKKKRRRRRKTKRALSGWERILRRREKGNVRKTVGLPLTERCSTSQSGDVHSESQQRQQAKGAGLLVVATEGERGIERIWNSVE